MEKMRRLSDKILLAHEQACKEDRAEVAKILLEALEMDLSTMGGDKSENREDMTKLEEAFERHNAAFS
jgi:hypothetical protein